MSEFSPVSTKQDLDLLDDDEIVAGYRYGFDHPEKPGNDKSRSFWHGWRNAQTDCGRAPLDDHQQRLCVELYGSRAN